MAEGTTKGAPVRTQVTMMETTAPPVRSRIQRLPTACVTWKVPWKTMSAMAWKARCDRPAFRPHRGDRRFHRLGVLDVHGAALRHAGMRLVHLGHSRVHDRAAPAPDLDCSAEEEQPLGHHATEAGAAAGDQHACALEEIIAEHDRQPFA
jgi:hypothetical protein